MYHQRFRGAMKNGTPLPLLTFQQAKVQKTALTSPTITHFSPKKLDFRPQTHALTSFRHIFTQKNLVFTEKALPLHRVSREADIQLLWKFG